MRQALALGAIVLAAGGIWMLRNWVETGNPLMPLRIDPLGITIFDAPPDLQRPFFGQTLASYFDQPSVWIDTLAHQFRIAIGLPLIVVAAGVVAALAALVRRGRRAWSTAEGIAAAAIAAALLLALVYAVTPYTAPGLDGPDAAAINVRYGIPAMIAAVPALAWLAGSLGPRAQLAVAVLALVATIDALRVGTTTRPAVVYASFAAAAADRRPRPRGARADAICGSLAAAGSRWPRASSLLAVLVVAGDRLQGSFNDSRYRDQDPVIDYVIDRGDDAADVGLAGAWSLDGIVPTYPAFGTRLSNDVTYLGPVEDDALLRTYTEPAEFTSALTDADPDLLRPGAKRHLPLPADADSGDERRARGLGARRRLPPGRRERAVPPARAHGGGVSLGRGELAGRSRRPARIPPPAPSRAPGPAGPRAGRARSPAGRSRRARAPRRTRARLV